MDQIPDETTIRAWVLLHRSHRKMQESVENSLKANDLPPLDWYDVLLELHRSGEAGLRQFEIGDKVLLNKHNLSRLIDRLEKKQLVNRHACTEDGRGNQIRITRSGKQLLKAVWPVYGESIQSLLGDRLPKEDLQGLIRILDRLLESGTASE